MDPIGEAISDFQKHGKTEDIVVHSDMFDDDVIPVAYLFRAYKDMPVIEQKALDLAHGSILDVGSAAGSHALYLQLQGKDVTAIDISELAVSVMKQRGVRKTQLANFYFLNHEQRYDTLLFLMNGTGIMERISNIGSFFKKAKALLNENGQIIIDSSDLRYLYENDDGSFSINIAGAYYGEVEFMMSYKQQQGALFNWLYLDQETLAFYANEHGFNCEIIVEGAHYDYLARLTLSNS